MIKIRLKYSLKNISSILGRGVRIFFNLRKRPLNLDIYRFKSVFLDALIKRESRHGTAFDDVTTPNICQPFPCQGLANTTFFRLQLCNMIII